MKTGYFYQLRDASLLERAVCIARGNPKGVDVKFFAPMLAPTWDLLNDFRNDKIDEAEYIRRYKAQLSKLNALEIYKYLYTLTDNKEPILMCHCGQQHFCHRHIVAEWFEEELSTKVFEIKAEDAIRKDGRLIKKCEQSQPLQMKMF